MRLTARPAARAPQTTQKSQKLRRQSQSRWRVPGSRTNAQPPLTLGGRWTETALQSSAAPARLLPSLAQRSWPPQTSRRPSSAGAPPCHATAVVCALPGAWLGGDTGCSTDATSQGLVHRCGGQQHSWGRALLHRTNEHAQYTCRGVCLALCSHAAALSGSMRISSAPAWLRLPVAGLAARARTGTPSARSPGTSRNLSCKALALAWRRAWCRGDPHLTYQTSRRACQLASQPSHGRHLCTAGASCSLGSSLHAGMGGQPCTSPAQPGHPCGRPWQAGPVCAGLQVEGDEDADLQAALAQSLLDHPGPRPGPGPAHPGADAAALGQVLQALTGQAQDGRSTGGTPVQLPLGPPPRRPQPGAA